MIIVTALQSHLPNSNIRLIALRDLFLSLRAIFTRSLLASARPRALSRSLPLMGLEICLPLPTKTNPSIREDLVALESPVVGLICNPLAEIEGDVALARPSQSGPFCWDDPKVEARRTGKFVP